jgi:hypothetical protein
MLLPALVFPTSSSLFCANEGGVGEQLVEVERPQVVEFLDQDGVDVLQHALAGPVAQSAPARTSRGEVDQHVPPARSAAQQPEDALQTLAVVRPAPAPFGGTHMLGQQRRDALPLFIRQDAFGVSHDRLLSSIMPAAIVPKDYQLFSCQTGL